MEEPAIATYVPAASPAQGRISPVIVQGLLLVGEALALIWLLERIASGDLVQAACLGQFLLAMAVASGSIYCATSRRRRVYDPIRLLDSLLPEIRAGKAPIEELSRVDGPLAKFAHQVQDLLRELRAQKGKMAEMDLEIRQRIANRTEALERKIGSLHNQAIRDVLTGLLNRRALNDHLVKAMERCDQNGLPISVLMIDVDNFKPLNDTLGHAAGDELLRSIGQLFRSTLRETDTAFRCGGDEFVIVLEGSDAKGAAVLSNRLVKLVDGLANTFKVAQPPRLSIGAATLADLPEPSADALLQEADKRLYAVKGDRKRGTTPPAPGKEPMRKSA
jgi:diguanylate cyclase (GGDEF)-like protein